MRVLRAMVRRGFCFEPSWNLGLFGADKEPGVVRPVKSHLGYWAAGGQKGLSRVTEQGAQWEKG